MIANLAMVQNLQILRLLAALWVVLLHSRVDLLVPAAWSPALPPSLQALFGLGYAGVDVFFVLSGVVMAEATRGTPTGPRASLTFLGMRLARIYTGWWPWCLLYLLGATLWQWPLSTAHLAASFWLAPLPEIGQYLLPILWSLAFELYFYAVTAVLRLLPRRWMRAGLAAWGLGIVGLGLWHLGQGHYIPAFEAQIGMVQRFWGSPLVLEFIAGFLLCDLLRAAGPGADWRPWALATLLLGALAFWFDRTHTVHPQGLAHALHTPERALFLGAAACALAGWALTTPPWTGPTGRWLAAGGDASYAIYLGHIAVLLGLYGALPPAPAHPALAGPVLLLAMALVLAVAWAWHRGLERPLYQRARYILQSWQGRR